MPILLALDTATDACSAALWCDGVIHEKCVIAPRQHADLLLPMIDTLLSQTGVSLSTIDAIAFGAGPGSFMGVRIATAVAQGLGFGLACKLIPISTLSALAYVAYQATQAIHVMVAWDARMGELYVGNYDITPDGTLLARQPDRLLKPEAVTVPLPMTQLAGNAWEVYRTQLTHVPQNLLTTARTDLYPHASAIATLAIGPYLRGEGIAPTEAAPVYLRNDVARKSN